MLVEFDPESEIYDFLSIQQWFDFSIYMLDYVIEPLFFKELPKPPLAMLPLYDFRYGILKSRQYNKCISHIDTFESRSIAHTYAYEKYIKDCY